MLGFIKKSIVFVVFIFIVFVIYNFYQHNEVSIQYVKKYYIQSKSFISSLFTKKAKRYGEQVVDDIKKFTFDPKNKEK